jgi:DNA modification methylase
MISRVLDESLGWHVEVGDALAVLQSMPSASVDAMVTDPPAGISFMGAAWDGDKGGRNDWIQWLAGVMRESLRVCKPGAHALVWALPRTSHWTAMACEDGGWIVRDRVSHLFAQGFPKSLNVEKVIDERLRRAYHEPQNGEPSPDAFYDGVGTALKPAVEDWWLLRKPCGTIADNVLAIGTGGLNIDACRIEGAPGLTGVRDPSASDGSGLVYRGSNGAKQIAYDAKVVSGEISGRWPANLALSHTPECKMVGTRKVDCSLPPSDTGSSTTANAYGDFASRSLVSHGENGKEDVESFDCPEDCPVRMLDEQSGDRPGMQGGGVHTAGYKGGFFGGIDSDRTARGDLGGASRFFFTSKPSKSEKEFGLEEMEAAKVNDGRDTPIDNAYQRGETQRKNKHPTVKSLALMRWLCRLITPPGGIVLDPFSGSGSTLIAARREGLRAIGIDQSDAFAATARARIERWEQVRPDVDDGDALTSSKSAEVNGSQTSLFGAAQ